VTIINEYYGHQPRITEESFLDDDRMIQFGHPPYRIDILVNVPGLVFEEVYPNTIKGKIGTVSANLINLLDLMKSKKAAGRRKDLGDLEALEQIEEVRSRSYRK
jgi:hypothetical protein